MKVSVLLVLGSMLLAAEARPDNLRREHNVFNACPAPDPLLYTVHLPHPQHCSMFLRCDHGVAKPERCPGQLHFNPALQVCDWPERAGCKAGAGDSNEWTTADLEPQVETPPQDKLVPNQGSPDEFVPVNWPVDDVQNEAVQDAVVDDGSSGSRSEDVDDGSSGSRSEDVDDENIFGANIDLRD